MATSSIIPAIMLVVRNSLGSRSVEEPVLADLKHDAMTLGKCKVVRTLIVSPDRPDAALGAVQGLLKKYHESGYYEGRELALVVPDARALCGRKPSDFKTDYVRYVNLELVRRAAARV